MNKFDVKVLLEETKKQTARDIIRMLNENLAKCMEKKEELIHNIGNKQMNYLEYGPQLRHLTGYEGALCDAIYCIEEDYKVGPRHILNPNPNLE